MTVADTQTEIPLKGFVGDVLKKLGDAVVEVQLCTSRRGIARIDPLKVVEVTGKLIGMEGSRLVTATGIDARDGIDILYHWAIEPPGVIITIKAIATRPDLAIDSIANVVPAGNWIEREMHDLLGANFTGHPDMRRLVLDDSWPEGVHPLRRSFDQILDRPPLPPNQTPPEVSPEGGAS